MATVANKTTWRNCLLEYSEDGVIWTEPEGVVASITQEGGERRTGEVGVFSEDSDVIGVGARQPVRLTIRAIYENSGVGFSTILMDAYIDKSPFWLRWYPQGEGDGNQGMESNAGKIVTQPSPAGGEATNAAPLTVEATLFTDEVNPVTRAAS